MRARSVRIGSATNQTGSRAAAIPVLHDLEPLVLGRRRQTPAKAPASRQPAHCSGRRVSRFWRRCIASTGGGWLPAGARPCVRMSVDHPEDRRRRRCIRPDRDPGDDQIQRDNTRDHRDADAPGRCRHRTRRQVRDRHDQRQRVAGRERLLKQPHRRRGTAQTPRQAITSARRAAAISTAAPIAAAASSPPTICQTAQGATSE